MWLVTGSTGFVGGHVLRALGERGRGLDRRQLGAWTADNLERALEGVEGVVHAASVVHRPGTDRTEYERFNVEGTRALLDAAEKASVRRVVFISSIKVHGEAPEGTIDERTPVVADGPYGATKAQAESLVLERAALKPIVLRLCPVYGRGDKGNVRTMIRAVARRRFLVPGDGSTRKSIVHVSTVADVVARATTSAATGVFVVADRRAPSIRELADAIARSLGRARPLAIPAPLLRGVAALVARGASLARMNTAVSPTLIDKSLLSSVCDPSKIERELRMHCGVDLDQSVSDEVAWLREIGDL